MKLRLFRLMIKLLGIRVVGEDCSPGSLVIYIST